MLRYFLDLPFYSFKKSNKLRKLRKILGARPRIDIIDEEGMKQRYEARNELWEFCKKDRFIKEDLEHHKIGSKELENLYDTLQLSGAGRRVKGHFVLVSIFFYSYTLDYCLNQKKLGISDFEMAMRCVEWFEKNQSNPIIPYWK